MAAAKVNAALIGSGNIGTDLMYQGAAQRVDPTGLDGRHRCDLRRPRDGARAWASRRRPRASTACCRTSQRTTSRSPSMRRRPTCMPRTARKLQSRGVVVIDLTPAAIGPYCVPPVNLAAARRQARDERQHGELRRPGDDPDGRGGEPRAAGELRRDRRHRRLEIGGPGHAQEHRRVHPHDGAAAIEKVGGAKQRQGDHHPEPGRAAADHARHRALPDRGRRPTRRRSPPRCTR